VLDKKLKDYVKQDIYPFHMPGHKRIPLYQLNPYEIDITEIEGFDNLHDAREILHEAQIKAAKVYGAKESFYLVNGSTCGILTAISASVKKGGKILVARNSHKSVYNGIFLKELEAIYVYPEVTNFGIQGQIKVEVIDELLQKNPEVEAVLITSPTYDGMVSDIKSIAEIVHKYQLPLIVDAAHGAHLGFCKDFPENPVAQGADLVIESVHKTLPSLTQTALLHVCSNRVSTEKIKKYLGIYETSSPSYILMAGIDRCMEFLKTSGQEKLKALSVNLDEFYERVRKLKNIKIIQKEDISVNEAYDFDKSKILIFSRKIGISGNDLYHVLQEKYHLQMEMASGQYVLALCSAMDTKKGLERLALALEEMDESQMFANKKNFPFKKQTIYRQYKQILPIYKVEEMKKQVVGLWDAVGKVAGEYLYLYPPGVPVLVPGEEITEEAIQDILDYQKAGFDIVGLCEKKGICIVKFS